MKLPRLKLKWPDISVPQPNRLQAHLHMRLLWMAALWGASILVLLALTGLLWLLFRI